jgi:hypothetical protein
MKTTVYRIQDAQGRGPFKPGFSNKWLDQNRSYYPDAPISELIRIKRSADPELHLAFACLSVDDVKKWVSESEMAILKKHGYNVVSMEADKIWPLTDQAIVGRKRQYRKGVSVIDIYPPLAISGDAR